MLGDLDLTFGGGDGLFSFEGTTYAKAGGILVQPDGKILVAGSIASDRLGTKKSDTILLRLNPNGTLDTTFGGGDGYTLNNIYQTPFPDGSVGYSSDLAVSITLQADGKIVVLSQSIPSDLSSDYDYLTRYNPDGTVDTTFGNNGIVAVSTEWFVRFESVTVQPNGKILVSGTKSNLYSGTDTILVRYNSDGSIDTTLDGDGTLQDELGAGFSDNNPIVQADGKILVGVDTGGDFGIVRFNSDGSRDTNFGVDGLAEADFPSFHPYLPSSDRVHFITIQPDGKILAGGFTKDDSNYQLGLVRYNSDGTVDSTFGTQGFVITDFGVDLDIFYGVRGLEVQNNGKIVATVELDNDNFWLVRYNSRPPAKVGSSYVE